MIKYIIIPLFLVLFTHSFFNLASAVHFEEQNEKSQTSTPDLRSTVVKATETIQTIDALLTTPQDKCTLSRSALTSGEAQSEAILPKDNLTNNLWNEEIWNARNARKTTPLSRSDLLFTQMGNSWFVHYPGMYHMDYDSSHKRLYISLTMKNGSETPPFKTQFTMLKYLAEKLGSAIEIQEIVRSSIVNETTNQALSKDFPSAPKPGQITMEDHFKDMHFFGSPNGRNTLDLIKKINPEADPFSLIQKVTLKYTSDEEYPDVIIHLKKPIKIELQESKQETDKKAFTPSIAP